MSRTREVGGDNMEQKTLDGLMYGLMTDKFVEGVEKITGEPCPREVKWLCGPTYGKDAMELLRYFAKEDYIGLPSDIGEYLHKIFLSRRVEVHYKRKSGEETCFTARFKSISATYDRYHNVYSLILKGPKTTFTYPVPSGIAVKKYYFQLIINQETQEPEALDFVIKHYGKSELVLRRNAKKKSKR